MVDSCRKCVACKKGDENYCHKHNIGTYNHKTEYGTVKTNSGYTFGGYSASHTVPEDFVMKVGLNWIYLVDYSQIYHIAYRFGTMVVYFRFLMVTLWRQLALSSVLELPCTHP